MKDVKMDHGVTQGPELIDPYARYKQLPKKLMLLSGMCPKCDWHSLRRNSLGGYIDGLLARFDLHAWECGLCRRTYFIKKR